MVIDGKVFRGFGRHREAIERALKGEGQGDGEAAGAGNGDGER